MSTFMRCVACGSESAPGAKFCASCGKPMEPPSQQPPVHVHVSVNMNTPAQGQPPPLSPSGELQRMQMLQQSLMHGANHGQMGGLMPFATGWPGPTPLRGRYCERCEQRTVPVPYFSRGANIAKLVVLFPFTSFVGPLLLFLLRKNRVICSYCQAKLPGHVPVPLLESFSSDGVRALAPWAPDDERQLATKEAGQEIALLERRSRRQRRRAWTLGVVTAGMATIGTANAVSGDAEANVVLFGLSGLAGVGALVNRQRSEKNNIAAEAVRQRRRVQEILGLARAHAGKLNVTIVASQLHLDFREAEALLDGMVDGRRVDVQVDEQGRMNYVFPELTP